MRDLFKKVYLGDGAYARCDGSGISLTTEDGNSVQNEVYLEPEVLAAFEAYIARVKAMAADLRAARYSLDHVIERLAQVWNALNIQILVVEEGKSSNPKVQ